MAAKENPSGINIVLLLVSAGVGYWYWKKKKDQQARIGELQLGLQMIGEGVASGEIVPTSTTGHRDSAQETTDKWTRVRMAEEQERLAAEAAAQPQNTFESTVDYFAPGLHEELR